MFTDDSIELRNYFFPKMTLKNSKELQNLYDFLLDKQRSQYEISSKSYFKEKIKKKEINITSGADNILKKTYKFATTSVNFIINNSNVAINLYSDGKNNDDILLENLIEIFRYVYSLSYIKQKYMVIDIYLVNQKKKISSNMKILGPNEINSGLCNRGGKTTTVTLYREEELLKVFIHELIHCFEHENYHDTENIIKHYKNKYNISSDHINTMEAYTEIWANLINCFLLSQKVGRDKYNLFLILIALEKEFAKFQAEKIIYLTGLNDKKEIDINKKTNVLSYFIIRYELYERLNTFLKFCNVNNDNYITIKDKMKWLNFLKKNKKILKNNRRFNQLNKKSFIFKTMRMSLNEKYIYACTY